MMGEALGGGACRERSLMARGSRLELVRTGARWFVFLGLALLLSGLWAKAILPAQIADPGWFTVEADIGLVRPERASAVKGHPSLGASIVYQFTQRVGAGAFLDLGRPATIGQYFPRARHAYADTTFLYMVGQRVTQRHWGLLAQYGWRSDVYRVAAEVGAGRYGFLSDPEVMGENHGFGGALALLGLRLSRAIGPGGAVFGSFRSYTLFAYDRDRLDPVHPIYRDTVWPEVRKGIPEEKRIVNVIRISLGLALVPGGMPGHGDRQVSGRR